MRRLYILVPAAILALIAAYFAARDSGEIRRPAPTGTPAAAGPVTVTGTITLTLPGFVWESDGTCYGYSRNGDLVTGANVVIADGTGEKLSVGRLDTGTVTMRADAPTLAESCVMPWTVTGVPTGGRVYDVTVGDHDPVTVTGEQIRALRVALSIR